MIHLESIFLLPASQLVSFKGKSSLSPFLELVLDNYEVSFWLWVSKTPDSHTEWYPEASRTRGERPAWLYMEPLHPHYELREVFAHSCCPVSVPPNQVQHRFLSQGATLLVCVLHVSPGHRSTWALLATPGDKGKVWQGSLVSPVCHTFL